MILDSTSDEVRLITSAAASIEVHVGYVDWEAGPLFTPGSDNVIITTATTTDIVASPAASKQRQVRNILARNDHASQSCDVTVEHSDGTDTVQPYKVTLAAGESFEYDGATFHKYDALGIEVQSDALVSLASGYLQGDNGAGVGVVPVRHYIRAATARTLPNDTNENALFNSPANGRITLVTGVYLFESLLRITSMSATSGNALLDWLGAGTATMANWNWVGFGADQSTLTTPYTVLGVHPAQQDSGASFVTAGTGTSLSAYVYGCVECTAGGTLIPSIDLVTAAAASLNVGSHFIIERIGATGAVSVGPWS